MTAIEVRQPPARPANGRRPIMPLDRRILEIVGDQSLRPIQIAQALRVAPVVDGQADLSRWYPDISTQRVASRLKALVNRELMDRIRPVGAPANGPGTSLYRKRRDDGQADG
jgi:hypothetical protein